MDKSERLRFKLRGVSSGSRIQHVIPIIFSAGQIAQHFFCRRREQLFGLFELQQWQPAGEEDKKNYLFVLTKILGWDSMGLI